MDDNRLCAALVAILVAALMGSPWMVYWFKHHRPTRQRRKPKGSS